MDVTVTPVFQTEHASCQWLSPVTVLFQCEQEAGLQAALTLIDHLLATVEAVWMLTDAPPHKT